MKRRTIHCEKLSLRVFQFCVDAHASVKKKGENHASNPLTLANFATPTIIFERIVPFDECPLARSAHNRNNSYSTIKKCFLKYTFASNSERERRSSLNPEAVVPLYSLRSVVRHRAGRQTRSLASIIRARDRGATAVDAAVNGNGIERRSIQGEAQCIGDTCSRLG